MDRQCREAAQKVKDYRTYHLSGDLSEQVTGQVAQGILHFESPLHRRRSLTSNTHTDTRSRSSTNSSPVHLSGYQAGYLTTIDSANTLTGSPADALTVDLNTQGCNNTADVFTITANAFTHTSRKSAIDIDSDLLIAQHDTRHLSVDMDSVACKGAPPPQFE